MRLAAWPLLASTSLLLILACSGRSSPTNGGDPASKVVQCDDYLACDARSPCESDECVSIPGCGTPICIGSSDVCQKACGTRSCVVLDSYPSQLNSCPDGTPIRGTGDGQPPNPPTVGTGGSSTTAGTGFTTGGYSTGGYATAGRGGLGSAGTASGGSSTGGSGPVPGDVIDCTAFARCGDDDSPCAVQGFDCVGVSGCDRGICAPPIALCNTYCEGSCEVLESYPVQLDCSTNDIRGVEGDLPGAAGAGGFGGSPQGWAGEPALAGASFGGENYGGNP